MSGAFEEILLQGQRVWPSLQVAEEAFRAYLEERIGPEPPADVVPAGDLYLACACAMGDALAIEAFEAHYEGHIAAILSRFDAPTALLDDARQLLRCRLFVGDSPRITRYRGRGTLLAFVRIVAIRAAIDVLKKEGRHSIAHNDEFLLVDGGDDPEFLYLKKLYGAEFKTAFSTALVSLAATDRSLLRYHLVDGFSIDKLGAIFRIHRSSAARRLARIREQLVRTTYRELTARLELGRSELDGILCLVKSNVDISASRLLASDAQTKSR